MARSRSGVLVIGHGTRSAHGRTEFESVVARVAQAEAALPVQGCFLELAEPDIPAGIAALVQRGVEHIWAAPLLLFTAGHAKQDIPNACREALRSFPGITCQQSAALEDHEAIVQLSANRFQTAVAKSGVVSPDHTLALLIGRGSSDAEACAKVRQFAEIRQARIAAVRTEVAFVEVAQPSLGEALKAAGARGLARVIVQPHLLFHGQVLQAIERAVEQAAAEFKGIEWLVADHLGNDPAVSIALLDRIRAANLAASESTAEIRENRL